MSGVLILYCRSYIYYAKKIYLSEVIEVCHYDGVQSQF